MIARPDFTQCVTLKRTRNIQNVGTEKSEQIFSSLSHKTMSQKIDPLFRILLIDFNKFKGKTFPSDKLITCHFHTFNFVPYLVMFDIIWIY